MDQEGPIDAFEFARKYELSSGDLIAKIKKNKVKGFQKGPNWYIESTEEAERLIPASLANQIPEKSDLDQPRPTITGGDSSIAGIITALGWIVLACSILVSLIMVPDSRYDPDASQYFASLFFAFAGFFQAALLWGFSAILRHLKEIAINTRALARE